MFIFCKIIKTFITCNIKSYIFYGMLWIEKYRPKELNAINTHHDITALLQCFTLRTVPNLIFYGSVGSNKKTLVFSLINSLYKAYPQFQKITTELQINGSRIDVSYLESNDVILINPSIYKNKDRVVVQNIIKKVAESKPITSFLNSSFHGYRTILIDQAENLTKDAQAALRITMEQYSSYFKIFMICTNINTIIEPIKSRSLLIRCRQFAENELITILETIALKEGYNISLDILKDIAINSNGDCGRAISLLEIYCQTVKQAETKKLKMDLMNFKVEWEEKLDAIVHLIREAKAENMFRIRQLLYDIIIWNIEPSLVLLKMHNLMQKVIRTSNKQITELALKFQERIYLGTKPIFHLEAYAANLMMVCSQEK